MAIVKELKNLGKKMTGADLTGNTVSEALKAIEEKYTGGGTPEPTYEVVAEIQVGDPLEDGHEGIPEGCAGYIVADTASAKAIMASAGDSLYFNNAETPLTRLINEMVVFGYNFTMDDSPVVTGQPAYLVAAVNEGETDAIVEIMSTEDLSNTAVKILKKVEEPSVGSDVLSVVFTLTSASTGTADTDLDDVKTAFSQGKTVLVHIPVPGETRIGYSYVITSIKGDRIYGVTIDDDKNLAAVVSERVSGDSYSFMLKGIPSNLKPTYHFGFSITAGQTEGTYIATPDTGVTYAAIRAALAETDNVYAVATLPNGKTVKPLFSDLAEDSVKAPGVFHDGGYVFMAYRLSVGSDDTCDVVIVPLAAAN